MHEEIELAEDNLPTVFDRARQVEEIGLMSLQGYTVSDIRERTGLAIPTIKGYIAQYKAHLQKMAEDNPYFLEETQLNTLRVMAEFDHISKEAYETVEIATREGLVPARTAALKLALDTAVKKGALLNLMGGVKTDGEYIARMQKAETVNQIISKLLRDVVADCEHCKVKVEVGLREAFALMDASTDEDVIEQDTEDAEIISD